MFWFQDHEHATFDDILGELKLNMTKEWAVCRMGGAGGQEGSRHPHLPVWSHRGDREEADSLQERQQVLEDAHLLSGEEGEELQATPTCLQAPPTTGSNINDKFRSKESSRFFHPQI